MTDCITKHPPFADFRFIGFTNYRNQRESLKCLIANGDNNFVDYGIVEGTVLFVQTNAEFAEGELNVFKIEEEGKPPYKLSRERISSDYFGRVIIAANLFE